VRGPGRVAARRLAVLALALSLGCSRWQTFLDGKLVEAMEKKDKTLVANLLEEGADPNAKGHGGEPLLRMAWDPSVRELLIAKGADLDAHGSEGKTDLMRAAAAGDLERVKADLAHGANLSEKDDQGWTAFRHAAQSRQRKVLEFFLDEHPELATPGEMTIALRSAAMEDDVELMQYLIGKGASIGGDPDTPPGGTLLEQAAWMGKPKAVRFLLDHGAPVDPVDRDGNTPLSRAASTGNLPIVQMLLAAGAAPDGKPNAESPPLSAAAATGKVEVVQTLLDHRAHVDVRGEGSQTPLYVAVRGNHAAVAELLLRAGADVDAETEQQETPLLRAAAERQSDLVRLLLDRGANVDARDARGATPLLLAIGGYGKPESRLETVRILLDHHAALGAHTSDLDTPLVKAVEAQDEALVELLLQRGADPALKLTSGYSKGVSALEAAASKPAIKALLERYAAARKSP